MSNIGWISTYNTRCGIATYSKHLIEHMGINPFVLAAQSAEHTSPDDEYTFRCWNSGYDDLNNVRNEIVKHDIKSIVVSYHPGLIHSVSLSNFIDWAYETNREVIILIHSLSNLQQIPLSFKKCFKLTVQVPQHLELLIENGFGENSILFPHGVYTTEIEKKKHNHDAFLVGNYGFFLPNKGIMELIQSIHILRLNNLKFNLRLVNAEYPITQSTQGIMDAKKYVIDNNLSDYVEFYNDFLPDSESLRLLSECDLYVHPYRATAEPTSGSVRYGLASGIPVAVTPNPIFDDLEDSVFHLPGFTDAEMAQGIYSIQQQMFNNLPHYDTIMKNAADWVGKHSYTNISTQLENIIMESLK